MRLYFVGIEASYAFILSSSTVAPEREEEAYAPF